MSSTGPDSQIGLIEITTKEGPGVFGMALVMVASVVPTFLQGLRHRALCPPRVTQLRQLLQIAEVLDQDPMRLAMDI